MPELTEWTFAADTAKWMTIWLRGRKSIPFTDPAACGPSAKPQTRRARRVQTTRQENGAACGARPAGSISGIMSDPLQILVVEDEKAVAHMIAMVLGGPASKVARAANGWEALIKIGVTARPFDVVITDHRMPRMTGLQFVRRLRAKNFGGKILVLSAHLSDEDIRAYEELSVDMMMSKPFDFDELQEALAVLNKKASVLGDA